MTNFIVCSSLSKKIFKILIFCLSLIAIERFCFFQTGGFRTAKISSDFCFSPKKTLPKLQEKELGKVEKLLTQPFHFLGSGAQCYAFLGEDEKTVLKVFKHYHLWPRTQWLEKMRFPGSFDLYRQKILENRKKRLSKILESYEIAFEDYREESALIFTHLQKSNDLPCTLNLIDPIGISHRVDPNQIEFILQKKAEPVFARLHRLLKQKDIQGAQKNIDVLFSLILKRAKKGLCNADPAIRRNWGFVEDQAIEYDIGSLTRDSFCATPWIFKKEFYYETLELKEWIESHYPFMLSYVEDQIHRVLSHESL